jgi:ADP-ribose pyrophosphatase YjhB (NUDIX family)|tara:strand:- start:524 stop:1015 length:492 start_codon:yes stop_codon:yes gene_type:complete
VPIKFARFGTGPERTPEEGMCLSSFLVVRKNDSVLVGKVGNPKYWEKKWFVPIAAPERWKNKWVLPAGHLLYGEHPDKTALRILREMLQQKSGKPKFLQTQSQSQPSGHWDICFIYATAVKTDIQKPAWFSEMKFQKISQLKRLDWGRGHGDILNDLGPLLKK